SPQVFLERGTQAAAEHQAGATGTTAPFLPVSIGRLEVAQGALRVVDPRAGWEASLKGVDLTSASKGEGSPLSGRLEQCLAAVKVGEHEVEGEIASGFSLDRHRAQLTDVAISIPESLEASGSLDIDFSGAIPRIEAKARAHLEPAKQP